MINIVQLCEIVKKRQMTNAEKLKYQKLLRDAEKRFAKKSAERKPDGAFMRRTYPL
ncbi:MAG: hypothetical protein Q7K40_04800 [bacterium]|nr:hypothetical protein [bacterium]